MSTVQNSQLEISRPLVTDQLDRVMDKINDFVYFCSDSDSYFNLPANHAERKSYVLALNGLLFIVYSQLELLLKNYHRDDLRDHLDEFYSVIRTSGFIKRCQDRPLGYMGDYITIEHVLNTDKASDMNSLGYEIGRNILESSLSQQHRNKTAREVHLIRETINAHEQANILCFSVGGCFHIREVIPFLTGRKGYTLHLHDTYDEAIIRSKERMQPVIENCLFYSGNLIRLIRKELFGLEFDLITMGGIMDYITDKAFIMILKPLYQKLKKGGRIYITQLSKYNLYKCVMHYLLFWDVIYRSEEDLKEVIRECGIPDNKVRITKDLTQVTYLVELFK